MASFKVTVRDKTEGNLYLVYVRIIHNRGTEYISLKTYIHESKVKITIPPGKKKKKIEILDDAILAKGGARIAEYMKKITLEDIDDWTAKQVVAFLTKKNDKIDFIEFCEGFIKALYKEGKDSTAELYNCALTSFRRFFGENIAFQDIKSKDIKAWIKTLEKTKRAKEKYLKDIKTMFKAGADEKNDYDTPVIVIGNDPFRGVNIPKSDTPKKRAVSEDVLKKFFSTVPIPTRKPSIKVPTGVSLEVRARMLQLEKVLAQKAQDVMKMSFCLCGMNTADLFNMWKFR